MEVIGFSIKLDSQLKLDIGLRVRFKETNVRPVGDSTLHKTKMKIGNGGWNKGWANHGNQAI